MKCTNCGFEYPEGTRFCPSCGTTVVTEVMPVLNFAAEKVLSALKDRLFLVICILMSATCVFSLASDGLPVINILITVFLWLTYAKSLQNKADANHLRCVSGSVYASYVVVNVCTIILIVCGAIITLALAAFSGSADFISGFAEGLGEFSSEFAGLSEALIAVAGWIIGLALIVAAVVALIFNVLGMKKIHRFAKSVYQGIMTQNPVFENPDSVKNWLMFFGVCSAISALGSISTNFVAFLSNGCAAAATIIASLLVKKYFTDNEVSATEAEYTDAEN